MKRGISAPRMGSTGTLERLSGVRLGRVGGRAAHQARPARFGSPSEAVRGLLAGGVPRLSIGEFSIPGPEDMSFHRGRPGGGSRTVRKVTRRSGRCTLSNAVPAVGIMATRAHVDAGRCVAFAPCAVRRSRRPAGGAPAARHPHFAGAPPPPGPQLRWCLTTGRFGDAKSKPSCWS